MSVIYRQVADARPIPFTISPTVTGTPTVALYDDAAKTIPHAGPAPTVTGAGQSYTYLLPTTLGAGTFYALVSAMTVAGPITTTDTVIVTSGVISTGNGLPLATATDFGDFGDFGTLTRDFTSDKIDKLMLRASRAVEGQCDRRLAPFTTVETQRLIGVDSGATTVVGYPGGGLLTALAVDMAQAHGSNLSTRDLWLRQHAPRYSELWAYSAVSIELQPGYGGTSTVQATSIAGPQPDTGHIRFSLGTFVPESTNVKITYSGGYQTIPDDLVQATVLKAAKFAIVAAEPQNRKDMSTEELDAEILTLLIPYIRS